jgi:hypothetical protein
MAREQRVLQARHRLQVMARERQLAGQVRPAGSPAPGSGPGERRAETSGRQPPAAAEEREPWRARRPERRPPRRAPWQAAERPRRRAPPAQDLRAPSARASRACRPGWALRPARRPGPSSRRRAGENHRRKAACHPDSARARCRPRRAVGRGSGRFLHSWPSTDDATDETGACPGPSSRPYVQYDACWSCRRPIDDRSGKAACHSAIGSRRHANAREHDQNDERRETARTPHGAPSASA